ncbi:Crp/Fnr family transcriptional regulator [Glacieibacterium frigidum]|uniref:Crp/Fnr family transcriptional regulator n=1 Tax=Glacieibacterium frigidum TaxID=2593303 RepID=A0A552UEW9_9SPHN|nr:Crp/Fnr family transcriptional regulator [Glacieibacterium frigidum]TRW16777.1 Crp/Fnr family transcriptional regulator [Glacieibacterium frigidum]
MSADGREKSHPAPIDRVVAGPDRSIVKNRLLAALTDEDYALLAGGLTRVELARDETMIEADSKVDFAWFPESGVCSMIATNPAGKQAEIGLIGREGLVDTTVVHGTDRTPLMAVMQIAGVAWRIRADLLMRVQADRPRMHALLLAYAQGFFIQSASTALSYAAYSIPQRLARWLLMTQDRLDGDEVGLTHERFALMLGVRRAGVTVAVQTLERRNLVEARRGAIRIVDRAGLRDYVGDGYGAPEAEYERLLGIALK